MENMQRNFSTPTSNTTAGQVQPTRTREVTVQSEELKKAPRAPKKKLSEMSESEINEYLKKANDKYQKEVKKYNDELKRRREKDDRELLEYMRSMKINNLEDLKKQLQQ